MIKRAIFPQVAKHLSNPEITLIIGARQVGKTYLMEMLKDSLEKRGEKALFLNLDIDSDLQFFTSQSILLNKIKLHLGEQKGYVFIDEIQRKENAGLFLKGLYDRHLPYKFIVSGSGSIELKEKIHESLSGRKRMFELTPLTFTEFVNFKTTYQFENDLQAFFKVEKTKTLELLEEYMNFGGYPKIVLAGTLDEKRAVMGEIYQSYLERDIKDLLKLDKTEAFTNLVKILASQVGGLINVSELSSTVGVAMQTIQNYLWYLEKTYIVKRVTPYFQNVRKEITKAPLYYFYDTGLRNYILGLFGVPTVTLLNGHLFENFVFNKFRESITYASTSIHFWRTRDNAEVDFVVKTGTRLTPVEAKYTKLRKPEIPRSMRSFLNEYKPKKAYIIHLGERNEIQVDVTAISFVPFYEEILTA